MGLMCMACIPHLSGWKEEEEIAFHLQWLASVYRHLTYPTNCTPAWATILAWQFCRLGSPQSSAGEICLVAGHLVETLCSNLYGQTTPTFSNTLLGCYRIHSNTLLNSQSCEPKFPKCLESPPLGINQRWDQYFSTILKDQHAYHDSHLIGSDYT